VQFDPDHQPRVVRRLEGVTAWPLANAVPVGDVLPFNRSGHYEVHCIGLCLGLVYGLRWEW
jgi:hypothetical protein